MIKKAVIIAGVMVLCETLWIECSPARVAVPLIDAAHADRATISEADENPSHVVMAEKNIASSDLAFNGADARIFDGKWKQYTVASSGTFLMSLTQTRSGIIGQYCAIAKNGNKIDCDPVNNPNITGVVNGHSGIANLTFSSFFGAASGKATIARRNNQLIWHVVELPQGGNSYAPLNAILHKN